MFVLRVVPEGEWSVAPERQISPPFTQKNWLVGKEGKKKLSMKLEVNRTKINENATEKWL